MKALPQLSPTITKQSRAIQSGLLLVFVCLLLLSGCSSLPKDFERTPSYAISDTTQTTLAETFEPMVAAHPGLSGFHALPDGIEALAARIILIREAEQSIDAQYYIWHDDFVGKALHNQLLDAADRGVRVRLLLDDLDTSGKDEMLHIIDAHPNIEIRLYNPFANRSLRVIDFITDLRRINHRMHNKTITVDNQATIFGGRNIGDEYFDADEEVGFSDLDALAIGPVVKEVSASFDLYWNSEWVYPLSAFKSDELIDDARITAFRKESDQFIEEAKESDYADEMKGLRLADKTNLSDTSFVWGEWITVYDQPSKVIAEEVEFETHLAPKLKKAFDNAQEEVLIISPYFVPGDNFTDYLTGLVDQGITVRVMTNSLSANDVAMVHAGYMRYRKALVRGGVELYEFKSVKSDNPPAEAKDFKSTWTGSERASLHAKSFAFDQQYIFIGSFNLDARSVALNTEFGVYFESPKHAKQMKKAFDEDAMTLGYRVLLNDNELEWVTLENGEEVRYQDEPETTFFQRLNAGFMSLFIPESQL
ncbi:phospholipase D family protein [Rubellicoccus peritrichatus]|uniref:Phospholipase D family protein n=1 Tax=Rubellicoccus peritrichatus TaxID=3080537 RepID=A0AAQ3LE05_9BACT|nr:phospholipase D family protein [Puniceicoccus sp. CR14]WOO42190.1 phospholipase D family protein [Puniceicoccus sp. CR14]